MSVNVGDLKENSIFDVGFTSVDVSGDPTSLDAGTFTAICYRGNSVASIVSSFTITAGFGGHVGYNQIRVDTSEALDTTASWTSGATYNLIVSNASVGGNSIEGYHVAMFSIEHRVADVVKISGDSTAANNLESQYDTTGLTGDSFPASQQQVGSIGASAGGALNFEANADNSGGTIDPGSTAFVGNETNNFTDTDRENGTRHIITDATNVIDLVYGFSVGGGRTATEMVWKGFVNANGDNLTLSAWDHPGAEWETLGTVTGKNQTTNETITEALLSKHTGTGSEIGKVYIRFNGSSLSASADLNTDQILIEAVNIGQTVGYEQGAVWIDTDDGVSGTESFVNGVADNPCLTLANAVTIAAAVKLHRFICTPDSDITFADAHTNEVWMGEGTEVSMSGQDCTGTHFTGMDIVGSCIGTAETHFDHCELGTVTLSKAHIDTCDLEGTVTFASAVTYNFVDCAHSDGTPTLDFGTSIGSTTVHVHNYHGALTIKNMGQSGTDVLHFSSADGKLTIDSSNIGGTVNLNGVFDFVNSGTSQTINDDGRISGVQAVKKNTALSNFPFEMTDSTTHNPKPSLTGIAAQRRLDSGAFASTTNAPTEVANGAYTIDFSAADLNGNTVMLRFTATDADDVLLTIVTRP